MVECWQVEVNTRMKKLTILLAVAALIISAISLYTALEANRIAKESSLPMVTAISNLVYDEEGSLSIEKISVTNGGQPLKNFRCVPYAIMEIRPSFSTYAEPTCLNLIGYFNLFREEYTGNNQGLLYTVFVENSFSKYMSVENKLLEAAKKDGYQSVWLTLTIVLSIDYSDQFGQHWDEYLLATRKGSYEMDKNKASSMLSSAFENQFLAESSGLNLYIDELDGAELWNWYKAEILEE